MPIKYAKLYALMKERGISFYRIKKDKVLGSATLDKVREGGNIDMVSLGKLCAYLKCQPGDITEYVEEKE